MTNTCNLHKEFECIECTKVSVTPECQCDCHEDDKAFNCVGVHCGNCKAVTQDWENSFDKLVLDYYQSTGRFDGTHVEYKDIKAFIRKVIAANNKGLIGNKTELTERFVVPKYILDQRVREYKADLVKQLEEIQRVGGGDYWKGHEEAIDEVIQIIKKQE